MPNQSNVIPLEDRVLGRCVGCGQPVLFAQNFFRIGRAFAHVGCAVRPEAQRPPRGDFPRPA